MVSNGQHAMGSVTNRPGKDAPLRSPVANPLPFVPSGARMPCRPNRMPSKLCILSSKGYPSRLSSRALLEMNRAT